MVMYFTKENYCTKSRKVVFLTRYFVSVLAMTLKDSRTLKESLILCFVLSDCGFTFSYTTWLENAAEFMMTLNVLE